MGNFFGTKTLTQPNLLECSGIGIYIYHLNPPHNFLKFTSIIGVEEIRISVHPDLSWKLRMGNFRSMTNLSSGWLINESGVLRGFRTKNHHLLGLLGWSLTLQVIEVERH